MREARSGPAGCAVQAAALQLLTSLLAFNLEIHSLVMRTRLVKRLVQLCRYGGKGWAAPRAGVAVKSTGRIAAPPGTA